MESMRSESIPIDHDGTISYQVVSKIARWKFSQIFTILSTWNPNSILIFNKCVNKSKLWALVKCLYIIYVLKDIEFSRMGTGYHTHLLSLVSKEKFYVVLRSLIKMLDWEWTESVSIDDLFLAVRIVKLDTQRLWWHRGKTYSGTEGNGGICWTRRWSMNILFFFPTFLTETWAQLPVADQEMGPRPNQIIEKGVKISLMSGVV